MMTLSHISAFLFWRAYDGRNFAIAPMHAQKQECSPMQQAEQLLRFATKHGLLDHNGKVHVSTVPKATPPRHPGIVAHSFTGNGDRHFFGVDEVAISSPELTFLQMASQLGKIPLAAAGSELCSRYAISTDSIKQRRAITSQQRIQRFLENSPRHGSIARAEAAASLIVDNARSPMEWKTCMLISLSHLNGGQNLPKPQMNCRIRLKRPLQSIDELGYPTHIEALECDMVWRRKQTVVVEYQGRAWHGSAVAAHRDATKNNKLTDQGIQLLELTAETINDELAFDDFCNILRKQLNCRNRIRTDKAEARKRLLRQTILPANWLEIALKQNESATHRH